jgi:hypothetical protein
VLCLTMTNAGVAPFRSPAYRAAFLQEVPSSRSRP